MVLKIRSLPVLGYSLDNVKIQAVHQISHALKLFLNVKKLKKVVYCSVKSPSCKTVWKKTLIKMKILSELMYQYYSDWGFSILFGFVLNV